MKIHSYSQGAEEVSWTIERMTLLLEEFRDSLEPSERFPDYTAWGGAQSFLAWLRIIEPSESVTE